jgi:hypothetical protein
MQFNQSQPVTARSPWSSQFQPAASPSPWRAITRCSQWYQAAFTLSLRMTVPRRDSCRAKSRYSTYPGLLASMKMRWRLAGGDDHPKQRGGDAYADFVGALKPALLR